MNQQIVPNPRQIATLAFMALCCLMLLAACGENMRYDSKLKPYEPDSFAPDEQSAQQVISGTVALGMLQDDVLLYTGKLNGQLATTFPFTVTRAVLARGQERFNIYCSPCHGLVGDGNGMIVQRGLSPPPSFHQQRLRDAPVGHFFDVITNGFGRMYSYAARVAPEDRWAIIAYIRALQLSQNATLADVPPEERQKLQAQGAGGQPIPTAAPNSPAAAGEQLFASLGCSGCHILSGSGAGPSLKGVFGSQVALEGGAAVTADEAYIRNSILNPTSQVVAGYQPIMPSFQGQISAEQLTQLIDYIKSLGSTK
jgi:mono/diheme cytochrome c family protein